MRAEPIVLITAERCISVDVCSADRGLKIKRHGVTTGGHGERGEEAYAEAAFQVSGRGFWAAWVISSGINHAAIGTFFFLFIAEAIDHNTAQRRCRGSAAR